MQEGVKRTPKHRRDANNGVALVLFVGGDADATGVAWTFLSKQDSSAGRRRYEGVVRRRGRRRYAGGVASASR